MIRAKYVQSMQCLLSDCQQRSRELSRVEKIKETVQISFLSILANNRLRLTCDGEGQTRCPTDRLPPGPEPVPLLPPHRLACLPPEKWQLVFTSSQSEVTLQSACGQPAHWIYPENWNYYCNSSLFPNLLMCHCKCSNKPHGTCLVVSGSVVWITDIFGMTTSEQEIFSSQQCCYWWQEGQHGISSATSHWPGLTPLRYYAWLVANSRIIQSPIQFV